MPVSQTTQFFEEEGGGVIPYSRECRTEIEILHTRKWRKKASYRALLGKASKVTHFKWYWRTHYGAACIEETGSSSVVLASIIAFIITHLARTPVVLHIFFFLSFSFSSGRTRQVK